MYEKKRGRDLLPSDMIRFRHLERVFREEAIRWGYQEIRTPTIEPLSLFTRAGTLDPRMLDNLYSFLDWDGWSGERVVLRPEGTIPTSRLFIEKFAGYKKARLFYIANMFTYDEEETSEHWQCGVELIERNAGRSAESDAEVAGIAVSILKNMGFSTPFFRVGYPPLIREALSASGLATGEMEELLALMTDRDIEGVRRVAAKRGLDKIRGLFDLSSTSADFIKNVSSYLPRSAGTKKALAGFEDSIAAFSRAGIPFEINFTLPLNFEYYTGLVMEVYPASDRAKKSDLLAAGGRYDNLIRIMSGAGEKIEDARAVGFALKVEHIIESPEFVASLSEKAVLIWGGDDIDTARRLVSILRNRGFIAEIFGVGQKRSDFRLSIKIERDSFHVTDDRTGRSKRIQKKKIKDVEKFLTEGK
jgi:histidyl-tRNA synthetase